MDWSLIPAWLPYLVAAALMLLLAVWLVALDATDPTHLAFAAFLFFRAVNMTLFALRGTASTGDEVEYYSRLLPYFVLPVPILLLYFASVYPRRRGALGRAWGGWIVVAAVVAVDAAYLLDHSLVSTYAPSPQTEPSYATMARGYEYVAFGPLAVLMAAPTLAMSLAALALAYDYVRTPPAERGLSRLLVLSGFLLNALFDGTIQVAAFFALLPASAGHPWLPWGWAQALLPALALLPAAATLAVLARDATPAARRLLAAAPIAVASALVLPLLGRDAAILGGLGPQLVMGAWRLVLPVFATWALLRHQLFDIDVRMKIALSRTTIGALFVACFFVVSELTASYLSGRVGTYLGIAAAGVLVFALAPLQHWVERVADRALPHAKPIARLSKEERQHLYREQLQLAWQDGAIRPKERLMLDNLRQRLGLTHEEAARLDLDGARQSLADDRPAEPSPRPG